MTQTEDALAPFRRTLERVRRRQDSHNATTLYFGRDALRDVVATLAERTSKTVVRLEIVSGDSHSSSLKSNAVWSDLAAEGHDVRVIYMVAHLGVLDSALRAQLRADGAAGIQPRIVNVAWLSDELAATATSDCILSDGAVLVFSPPHARSNGGGGLWTITDADEHLGAANEMLTDLWNAGRDLDSLPTHLDLEEPLAQSAKLIGDVAPVLCVGDHVDPSGCSWYHGAWQYLRLMNLVSTPSWHDKFYTRELQAAVAAGARSLLVSGTADYSVFAYLVSSLGEWAPQARLTVVDRCNTPLFACQWYAKRVGLSVTSVSDDIRAYADEHAGQHDLIVTDAFLTRFQSDECRDVLDDWYQMLRDGGLVVTTVRIHSGPGRGLTPDEAVAGFRDRAATRWRRWQPFIDIDREQVGAMAERYARRMISNPIGSDEDIRALLESRFTIVTSDVSSVPGELYPTEYLRVVLRKDASDE